jgi:hypothetical protein
LDKNGYGGVRESAEMSALFPLLGAARLYRAEIYVI